MGIGIYLLRRLFQIGPLLFLISICVFALVEMAPGDPVFRITRRPGVLSPTQIHNLRKEYGLDDPILIRYFKWLSHAVQGDLGYSYVTRRPVLVEISERLLNTLYLMITAFTITLLSSIAISMVLAAKSHTNLNTIVTGFIFLGQAIPVYWLGIMLILIFYGLLTRPFSNLPMLPVGGIASWGSDFNVIDRLEHLVMPVFTLVFGWAARYVRFLRSSFLEILPKDYIVAARARGIPEPRIIRRHAFKNAALPLVTIAALDLPAIIAGALIVEIIFSWPGIGRLFYDSAKARDYPVVMAIVMMLSVAILLSNLIADIIYVYLDPRLRFGKLNGAET